jgi:exopolysaccharide biosynthesis WecB/TagA/CpsF family protein
MKINVKSRFDSRADCRIFSFLNLSTLNIVFKSKRRSVDIVYYCDGFLMAFIMSLLLFRKVERNSFDFTSLAHKVFNKAGKQKKNVYIVGSRQDEVELFVSKIKEKYIDLNIVGYRNGYISNDDLSDVCDSIIQNRTDLVVVGMGAGKQEDFLVYLKERGYLGYGYTCGGFIHQTAMSKELRYYPRLINKFNLRFLYRMYKEPYTIKRYFFVYHVSFFKLIFGFCVKRYNFKLVDNE